MFKFSLINCIAIVLCGCAATPPAPRSPAEIIRDTAARYGNVFSPDEKARLLKDADEWERRSKLPTACGYAKDENTEFYGPNCAWMVKCKYDDIKDLKSCRITKPGLHQGITVFVFDKAKPHHLVSVGYKHHPGFTTTIRVDNKPPISTTNTAENEFSMPDNERIVSYMKNGQSVASVVYTWPYAAPEEVRHILEGFPEALAYAHTWLAGGSKG